MGNRSWRDELRVLWLDGDKRASGSGGARLPAVPLPGVGAAVERAQRWRSEAACLRSDIVPFVVFCRLRYRLTLHDLSEIIARGIEVSHEAIRDWEAKLLPVMDDALRCNARG